LKKYSPASFLIIFTFSLFTYVPSSFAADTNPGAPTLYWTFSSLADVTKESASNTSCTLNGNATYTANGKFGGGLLLDGSGDFVSCGSSTLTNLPIGNSNYTISVWVKSAVLNTGGYIGWGEYGSGNRVNAFRTNNDGIQNYWWGNDLIHSSPALNLLNQWHHAVVNYNGTNRTIYFDGALLKTDTPGATLNSTTSNFAIGRTAPMYSEFYNGTLDDLSIWNRALTLDEITYLYNSGIPNTPAAPTSLIATAGDGQATISFTAGSSGASAITNYEYSLDGTTYSSIGAASSPVTVTGLTNGTTYSIYLRAVNTQGSGTASSSVSVTPVASNTGGGGDSSSNNTVIATPIINTSVSGKNRFITWDQSQNLVLTTYNKTTKKTKELTLSGGSAKLANPKPGQTATYTISSASGEILKTFTIKSKPDTPKKFQVEFQASTLNATWKKAVGAKKYRVTITPEVGKPIVLTTTDPNISIDLENSAKATIKVVAIGANGLASKAIKKSI
jgi:hypothetical protein